jgi:hypothetical protein
MLPLFFFILSCDQDKEISAATKTRADAGSIVTVIVDLSGSWLTTKDLQRNKQLLTNVGKVLFQLSDRLPHPIVYRYLPIKTLSFHELPLCETKYAPTILAPGRKKLSDYLTKQCPQVIVTRGRQKMTDITGAIISFADSVQYLRYERKMLLILSDMREEVAEDHNLELPALPNTRIVLLYRVLKSDQATPQNLRARIKEWQRRLEGAGADVRAIADSYLDVTNMMSILIEK